jgi:hypothetical protein
MCDVTLGFACLACLWCLPQGYAPAINRFEINAFSDVYAAFESRHYGTVSPKPAPPPIRRVLQTRSAANVTMEVRRGRGTGLGTE